MTTPTDPMTAPRPGPRGFALRPPTLADVPAVARIAGDPRTNIHIPGGAITDPEAVRRLVARWVDDWKTHAIGYALVVLPTGEVVGWVGLRLLRRPGLTHLNLAYHLAIGHHGRGIATAAVTDAVRSARSTHPQTPIVARIAAENAASHRLARKVGLTEVGTDRDGWPVLASRPLTAEELDALPVS